MLEKGDKELKECERCNGSFSYQVIRHGSRVGNSQDLREKYGVAIPSDPQIHNLLKHKSTSSNAIFKQKKKKTQQV